MTQAVDHAAVHMPSHDALAGERRARRHRWLALAAKYAVLLLLSAIILGPVLTAVLGSMRTTAELLAQPFGLPTNGIQWENYTSILESAAFWNSARNSLIITTGVAVLNITLASMMAFAFSRVQFFGRGLLFNILSFGLLFPLVVALLPV